MRKLFWDDPYLTETEATIQRVEGVKVLLDQTIIYSFSGGQQSDEGAIGGIPVVDSEILPDDGSIVYSLRDAPSFAVGESVRCDINWEKRYRIMRLHSATHVAMAVLYELEGALPVIGANVTSDKGRIDFRCDTSLTALVPKIQKRADDIVQQDLTIVTQFVEVPSSGEKRIWMIAGLGEHWAIPCGGTHPRSTGEIRSLTVKRRNLGAGKERLEVTLVAIC